MKQFTQFTKTDFFRLMQGEDTTNIRSTTLEKAYDEFAGVVFKESALATDMDVFHQALCYAQVELTSLQNHKTGEIEKKCLPFFVFRESSLVA
jgi:ABC-type transporter Mla maintaining outer membrane lipid asymmetry ATPase subunit MlaF